MSLLSADSLVFGSPYESAVDIAASVQPKVFSDWLPASVVKHAPLVDRTAFRTPQPQDRKSGRVVGGVNDMLYGRIYLEPAILNLGNLVSAQTRAFSVWNATFSVRPVQSLTASGDQGLTLTQPKAVPYSLKPLQQVFYQLSISLDGPATLDAIYSLTIDGQVYVEEVRGSRVVIWPFEPNWASPVNESLEWLTNVIKSFDGSEQRISVRTKARRRLAYDFRLFRALPQYFDNILWGWQNRAFAVPYWPYRARTTAAIQAGSLIVPVPTSQFGFAAGQTLALIKDVSTYEVLEIAQVDPNQITLKNAASLAWPAGSRVYPVGISTIDGNVAVNRQSSSVLDGTVTFTAQPIQTDPFVPARAATDVYNGFEVILKQPDWAQPIDNSAYYPTDVVDFATGDRQYAITERLQSLNYKYRWILKGRTEAQAFRAFLGRLKGQLNPVYIPSWHEDFELSRDVNSTDVSLYCVDRSFFNLVGVNPARGHLQIRSLDGTWLRPIASAARGDNGEVVIGIGSPIGVDVPRRRLLQISYLSLYRKSSDTSTLQWQTDEVAIVEENFQLVDA